MDPKDKAAFTAAMAEAFDGVMAEKLAPMVGEMVANQCKGIVESLRIERSLYGKAKTGLSEETKKDFVEVAKMAAGLAQVKTANLALIEEQDNRGGYLVSREVADAIMRIAASVGLIMSKAQKWPMTTDELGIPNYTGAFLTGSYLGVDVAGTPTGLVFGQAALIAKKWQLAFVVGNDLLADATVQLADWLLAMGGEALANQVDSQGLTGAGAPFVGVLNATGTTVYTLDSGKTKYSNTNATTPDGFEVLLDGAYMIGQLEESVLDGACWVLHRTVWAAWRGQKDSAGNYVLPYAAWAPQTLESNPIGGGIKEAGYLLGYPVYTNRNMPALPTNNGASASTQFAIFGNFKAMAYGDRGEMRVAQFDSGAFGGKEIALADQKGLVYKHRHALVIALPAAFVIAKTHA